MHTPAQELTLLGVDDAEWSAELVETRSREATDGERAHLDDGVLLLRRAG
jgi:hypothetical protein